MGLQDVFFQMRLPFDAPEAREISKRISEEIYYHALAPPASSRSRRAATPPSPRRARPAASCSSTPGRVPSRSDTARWDALRERIQRDGLRNSLLIAIAPTATIASICGCYECIEPQVSNLFKRETLSGDFFQVNRYLVTELKALGLWTTDPQPPQACRRAPSRPCTELPAEVRTIFRTAWELPMASLIDMAADRGAFIDQSQSLNLFMESPNIGQLSSMYFYAWKKGLKTTYYLRSRPATRIAKTAADQQPPRSRRSEQVVLAQTEQSNNQQLVSQAPVTPERLNPEPIAMTLPMMLPPDSRQLRSRLAPVQGSDADAVACSLENPESCEACQ